jgi:four helix bundle protein
LERVSKQKIMDEIIVKPKFKNNLQERLFDFAVKVIKMSRDLPKGKEFDVVTYQFIKSATSSGANYDESQGAVSKPDFSNKIGILLKEMRESNYWIRIVVSITENNEDWLIIRQESGELMNILGSIYSKTSVKR